jgi:prepilin-type N-terminal cleavage/methylation domain-containing protein
VRLRPGFTLIEMLAVVALIALVGAFVVPNVAQMGVQPLRDAGERLAADFELARERATILGVPHRVVIDLEGGAWQVEWYVTEARALGLEEEAAESAAADTSRATLDLAPPRDEEVAFHPIPDFLDSPALLGPGFAFVGLETTAGPVTRGSVAIPFEADGSTDPVRLALMDEDRRRVSLAIEALEERVRVEQDATE